MIALVYIKDKNYYPQVFLKECKHVVRKKRSYSITDDTENCFDDSDDSDDSDEKTEMKKNKYIYFFIKEKQEQHDKFTFLKKIRKISEIF